jgi:hypothetical protein
MKLTYLAAFVVFRKRHDKFVIFKAILLKFLTFFDSSCISEVLSVTNKQCLN